MWRRTIWAAVAFSACSVAFAQQDCLRMAFGTYCLGGLATALPAPTQKLEDGGLAWVDGDEVTLGRIFEGRLALVIRIYKPASRLEYLKLQGKLTEAFGANSTDESYYPKYADDSSSRDTAIAIGEGEAVRVWKPSAAYSVRLAWTHRGLTVAYRATALADRMAKTSAPGF